MSVSSIGAFQSQNSPTAQLTKELQNSGLSEKTAKTISSQIDSIVQSSVSDGGAPDKTKIKDAINQQLKSDVANGTLTQDQANAVISTLDKLDQQAPAGGAPPPSGGSGGGQAADGAGQSRGSTGGGSGGSSSSSKTETNRTTEKQGSEIITTITYSDHSKETSTSYDFNDSGTSTSDTLKKLISSDPTLSSSDKTKITDYLNKLIETGVIKTIA